mmetsp:Transcript_2558/g.9831  ORF Transcript_2558/g.9831 Transcript_2558/m.9831 type:complete len:269 (-) Transcript_2558:5-811(-)
MTHPRGKHDAAKAPPPFGSTRFQRRMPTNLGPNVPSASDRRRRAGSVGLLAAVAAFVGGGFGGGPLARDAAGAALAVGRGDGEVDVLLRVDADHEGGHVDDLLADADVALLDEDARVVDRLGEALLEDLGLEAAFEEFLRRHLEHRVELELRLVEEPVPRHAPQQRAALEDALRVLRIERQELARGLADLGEGVLHAPQLALAPEPVLAQKFELAVDALLLVRPPRRLRRLRVVAQVPDLGHGAVGGAPGSSSRRRTTPPSGSAEGDR